MNPYDWIEGRRCSPTPTHRGRPVYLLIRDNGCPEVILATLDEMWRDEEQAAWRERDPNSAWIDDVIWIDDRAVLDQLREDQA